MSTWERTSCLAGFRAEPHCAEWLVTQSARVLFSCLKSQREEATQLTAPDLSLETAMHELQTGGSPGKSELFWKEQSRKAASAVGLVEGTVTLVLSGESQRTAWPRPLVDVVCGQSAVSLQQQALLLSSSSYIEV